MDMEDVEIPLADEALDISVHVRANGKTSHGTVIGNRHRPAALANKAGDLRACRRRPQYLHMVPLFNKHGR